MKRGVTLTSMIVAVSIIAILTATVVISAMSSLDSLNKQNFVTEYIALQDAIVQYYNDNNAFPVENSVTIKISSGDLDKFEGEKIASNQLTLYKVNFQLVGFDDLKFGNQEQADDIYAVSIDSGILYYLAGIEYQGEVYYKVTKELAPSYDFKLDTRNTIQVNDVYFTLSNSNYTNAPIVVDVKIPASYTFSSVVAKSYPSKSTTITVGTAKIEGGYKVMQVNGDSGYVGNYTINVTYKDDGGATKQAIYNVTNSDSKIDLISGDRVYMLATGRYVIRNLKVEDYESGIKMVKYDTLVALASLTNEEISNYFQRNGKEIERGAVLSNPKYCVLYVEDKAGNYEVRVLMNKQS